ncbi:bis(5'-nucleosyl)-tetraphosphatase (symmetrical) YqeK [Faecalimonas sp.]
MKSLNDIEKILEKILTETRFQHTLGVMYTAGALAMKYDVELNKAMLAGLLHDCAKCIPLNEQMALCKKYNISLTKSEESNPSLIHSKLGAYLAKDIYEVTDDDILNAISWHTTGRPSMSLLEKIIYIADYIEPRRKYIANLPSIRKLAFENIDQTILMISESVLQYLTSMNAVIDDTTRKTYEFYKQKLEKGEE